MAPLAIHLAMLSSIIILFAATKISGGYSPKRVPLGGSVFSLDSRQLSERQNNNLGADCGGDPNCTTTDFGCGCGFVDGSWMDDPSTTGGQTSSDGVSSTSVVDSSAFPVTSVPVTSVPVASPLGSSPTSQPAPVTTTSTASQPSSTLYCVVDGFNCDCSDGSHPEQDEDGRCCLNVPNSDNEEQCWTQTGVLKVRTAPTSKQ